MKTGIIKAIYDDGEFDTNNGHFYAYEMLIQFPGEQQQTKGGINAKSHPYPLGNGEEITVDIKETAEHGTKFKKVNPQYAQGGSQGGGQATGGQSSGGRNYDAENRGKCRTQFIKAGIIAGKLRCDGPTDLNYWTEFAMTGVESKPPQKQYTGNSEPDDNIPF